MTMGQMYNELGRPEPIPSPTLASARPRFVKRERGSKYSPNYMYRLCWD